MAPALSEPIYMIAHIDAMPPHEADAKAALVAYAQAARQETGAVRIDAVQEVFQNHFDLVEVWQTQKNYRAHLSSPAWRRLRATLNDWLGSPINERIGTFVR